MENASSALAASGNNLEQSIALLTAANVTTQNASKSSTGLRTIAARLRNTKVDLEELGEEMTDAQYQKLVNALTKQKVSLTDVNGEFRSTYDILHDISKVWDEMSSMDQSALANAASGTRQQSIFFSIIDQFREAEGAMEAMANSQGELQESYDIQMQSTTSHINKFKVAFESLGATIFDTGFINPFIDMGTAILSLIQKLANLVNQLGGLQTILISIAGIVGALKFNKITAFFTSIGAMGGRAIATLSKFAGALRVCIQQAKMAHAGVFGNLIAGITSFNEAVGAEGLAIKASQLAFGGLFAVIATGIAVYSNIKRKQAEVRQEIDDNAESAKKTSKSLDELIEKYEKLNETNTDKTSYEEQAKQIQQDIVDILGSHNDALDLVNGKYKEQLELLKQINYEEAVRTLPDLKEKADQDVKDFESGDVIKGDKQHVSFRQHVDDLTDMLIQTGFSDKNLEDMYGSLADGALEMLFNSNNVIDIREVMKKIQEHFNNKNLVDQLIGLSKNPSSGFNPAFSVRDTIDWIDTQTAYYDDKMSAVEQSLGDYLTAKGRKAVTDQKFDIKSQTGFNEALQWAEDTSKEVQQEYGDLGVDIYRKALQGFIKDEYPQYVDTSEGIVGANQDVKTSVEAVTDAMADLKSAYSVVDKAREDMKTGSLSEETLAAMEKETPDYMDYVNVSPDGRLTLDEEKWSSFAQTKVDAKKKELQDEIALLSSQNEAIKEKFGEYWELEDELVGLRAQLRERQKEVVEEGVQGFEGITKFGNVDLSDPNRKIVWDENNIKQYKDELNSLGVSASPGEVSTALGSYDQFGEFYIAYTPIMQTPDGTVLLNDEAVKNYIMSLVQRAAEMVGEGNPIPIDLILKMDAEGAVVDGEKIQNVIAEVNQTEGVAEAVSKAMHFAGPNSDLTQLEQKVQTAESRMRMLAQSVEGGTAALDAYKNKVASSGNVMDDDIEKLEILNTMIDRLEKERKFSYIDQISQADSAIKELGEALGTFEKNGKLRASDFDGLTGLFGYLDSYEDFVQVASNSSSTYAQVQAAANALGAEFVNSIGILDKLDDSNKGVIESMLTSIGVTNAHEVVTARLTAIQLEAKLAEAGLTDAVWEDVQAFLQKTGATNSAIQALQSYRIEAVKAKAATLDFKSATASSIEALLQQAEAAGIDAQHLANLARTLSLKKYLEGASGITMAERSEINATLNTLEAKAKGDIKSVEVPTLTKFNIDVPKVSSGSGNKGSSKEPTEPYIAEIEKFRKEIEDLNRVELDKERLELHFDNSDLKKRNELMQQLIDLDTEEQKKRQALVAARRKFIDEGVAKMRKDGFNIEWDPEKNKLFIKNLEHINELMIQKKDPNKTYKDAQEAINDYRKDAEELAKKLEEYNEANQDESQKWWELEYSKFDRRIEYYKNQIQMLENGLNLLEKQMDKAKNNLYKNTHEHADTVIKNVKTVTVDAKDESKYKELTAELEEHTKKLEKLKEEAAKTVNKTDRTVFGNINTETRKVLDMTEKKVKNIPVAFTPMLQTGDGEPEQMTQEAMDKYLDHVIGKALAEQDHGTFSMDVLAKAVFEFDREGFEVDGKKIKNMIAAVGDEVDKVKKELPFTGNNSAIADEEKYIKNLKDQISALDTSDKRARYAYLEEQLAKEHEILENMRNEAAEGLAQSSMTVFANIGAAADKIMGVNEERIKEAQKKWDLFFPNWHANTDFVGEVNKYKEMLEGLEEYKDIQLAFSPVMKTADGETKTIDVETMKKYLRAVMEKATEGQDKTKLSVDVIAKAVLEVDSKGLDIDGMKISGVIKSIGTSMTDLSTSLNNGLHSQMIAQEKVIQNILSEMEEIERASMNLEEDNVFKVFDSMNEQKDKYIEAQRQIQNSAHETAEALRAQGYDDSSDEIQEYVSKWWEAEDNIKQASQDILDTIQEFADKSNDILSEVKGAYDTFKDAANEYAENGGYLSIETYQNIIELGPEYIAFLKSEGGLLKINEAAVQDMIAAKTRQLALDQAIAFVARLEQAVQENSIEDLHQLLYATQDYTKASWGLLYSRLALIDLTDDERKQAKFIIDGLYSLGQAAATSVGMTGNNLKAQLEEDQDYMNDLIKHVENLIKQKVEELKERINKVTEAYEKLVEIKKKSIELDEDTLSYQRSIEKKVKEMAKLQKKIDALGLDDSRDAQAQKKKLLEEMHDLQLELDDTQREHSVDKQQESLDQQQSNYEDAKKKELEALDKLLSSEQKLYEQA